MRAVYLDCPYCPHQVYTWTAKLLVGLRYNLLPPATMSSISIRTLKSTRLSLNARQSLLNLRTTFQGLPKSPLKISLTIRELCLPHHRIVRLDVESLRPNPNTHTLVG
jgi:hypothetical protein